MNWYQDKKALGDAVEYLMRYGCCYEWSTYVSEKTPCYNYKDRDKDIPEELCYAIEEYLNSLSREDYSNLNREISLLLGERFFVRQRSVIKILSRLLVDGNPCENTHMTEFALRMQINQRIELLETLKDG